MSEDPRSQVTNMLSGLGDEAGSPAKAEELMALVYDELRRLAARFLGGERKDHTLQPTALVHEAYLRLVDQTRVDWRGRTHFIAIGARMMRRLLIDHARRRGSAKRGDGWQRVTLAEPAAGAGGSDLDPSRMLDLHEALERLSAFDERQARVVELRFFGGLTTGEIAEALGVSTRTVEGDWTHARAWLRRELSRPGEADRG